MVDDEPDVLELIGDILSAAGHRVQGVPGGREALAAVAGEPPDLVITDLLMPGMNGLTVIREVLQRLPGTAIIAISGGDRRGGLKFLSVARTFGKVLTLDKPFHQRELLGLVRAALAPTGPGADQ